MRGPVPVLAISMGDPAGIGPEVLLKAATVKDVRDRAILVVFGDPGVLERASADVSIPVQIVPVDGCEEARSWSSTGVLPVVPVSRINLADFRWAAPTDASDRAQVEYIRAAYAAVASGSADGLVTGPISKASISRAGVRHPGHTELLAELAGVERPVMMLAGPTLKVVPLTTHVALRDVPSALSADLAEHAIRVTDAAFRRHFGRKPRIAVAGLNPHAGEGGLFGDEELRIIQPALDAGRAAGIDVSGPHPADTVFHRAVSGAFDVVIGMYHDQALIPIKLLDFDSAVNVTLGLPIIRTSVDHGTAYDIAGQGVASASSMIAALKMASRMVLGRGDRGESSPRGRPGP